MGLFSKKKPTAPCGPIPSSARTTQQWRQWEAARGCAVCGRRGCDRMRHSYDTCGGCGSAYCNGDACPGTRRK